MDFKGVKKMKIIKSKRNILIVILMTLVVGLSIIAFGDMVKDEETIGSDIVEKEILNISELSTIKYNYKNVAKYEDVKKFKGINIPFTSKSFLLVYSGYVKAGVDLEDIDISIKDDKNITIKMNEAKILDNVINEKEAEMYDEDSGLFNKLKYDDLLGVLSLEKEKIKDELIEDGFLDEANKHTEKLVKNMLGNLGFEKVDIYFR